MNRFLLIAVLLAAPLGAQSLHEAIREQVTAIHQALPRLSVHAGIEQHRMRLGAVYPAGGILTAQDVKDASIQDCPHWDETAGRLLLWEGARAVLEVNWVAATILGRVAEAERIERELLTLEEEALAAHGPLFQLVASAMAPYSGGGGVPESAADSGGVPDGPTFDIPESYSTQAFLLAYSLNEAAAARGDVVDPDGNLRQRLEGVRDRLEGLGEIYRTLGY